MKIEKSGNRCRVKHEIGFYLYGNSDKEVLHKIAILENMKKGRHKMKLKMVYKDRNITVTEKNKKFYRKDKKLTVYSFNCGYIEVYNSTDEKVKVFIEKDGLYHVKLYHNNPDFLGLFSRWECFDTLTEARKYCSYLLREIQKIEISS